MKSIAAIAAASELRPGRYPDCSRYALAERVLEQLFREHAIDRERIDGLLASPAGMAAGHGADVFVHETMADVLGIRPRFAETLNAGGATFGIMVIRAASAIACGLADCVLCFGAGKFPDVGAGGGDLMARMVSHPDYEYIYGTFIPALYALAAMRHMHERGTTRRQLASVAVTARAWALRNPQAIMRDKGPISVDDVIASRPIAEPFHLLDCSVPCEGGAAFVVARSEIARSIASSPAYLLGSGEHHAHGRVSQSRDFASMEMGVSAARAFEMAKLPPSRVRVAEVYDAFTINPIIGIEELGFVPPGGGGRFFEEGRALLGGDLPVNTYGGLLSFGHTGDTSGMSPLVEGVRQVMGSAGERQVKDADVALVHVYGGMMAEHCTLIFGRDP
jgi:acetyl-CoA acetyltransferase